MAAQVEVQTGEVGRTGVGGRLHLSPLTDSSNKSIIEGPSSNQGSLIITPEPSKPVPGPKPRLTPKPFAVERNPTIRPILAPKPHTKPRPEPTRPTGYRPDLPGTPKPHQSNVTGKPGPVSTNPNRPAPTSFKPSSKLNTGQTTKPVVQPFKPAPPLVLGDPSKPDPPQPAERQKPGASRLPYCRSPKKPPAAEWSGTTKMEEEKEKTAPSKGLGAASITRAKSMDFLSQMGQEENKPEAAVPLRPQHRGSRPRPVSAIFFPSPTAMEPPSPAPRWAGRRPLSADLTSKFESIGLSLHRKPPKANSKENTPEEKTLLQRREMERGPEGTTTTPQGADGVAKPAVSDQGNKKKKETSEKEMDEEKDGSSIKRRISLLLDSSSSPGAGATGQVAEPHSPVQPVPESEALLGVKQRIKQLTEDPPSAQSPLVKQILKPRPLPLDLTKRFTSERSTDLGSPSFSEATECHESDKTPKCRVEESATGLSDQGKMVQDSKASQEQLTEASMARGSEEGQMAGSTSKESGPSSEVQTVRASLFENVVEKHSVLVVDEEDHPKDKAKALLRSLSLKRGDNEDEGTLVTATYREPVSPSSPLRVLHSFDSVQAVEENRVVSENLPLAQLEDKAMTLRSRRSEGNRPAVERDVPVQAEPALASMPEQKPRYLRVGALHKWTTADLEQEPGMDKGIQRELERERQLDLEKERERQREGEREEAAAAPKRLKMLEADEQPKLRATYFALTGQMQEPVSPGDAGADRGDTAVLFDDFPVVSGQWGSQGKIVQLRNPSLNEAFAKSPQSQNQGEESIERSQISERGSAWDRQVKEEEMEIEKQRELKRETERQKGRMKEVEREKQRRLEIERQAHLEFARMKEREMQREFERQRQKEFERQKQELEEKRRVLERQKQLELEKEKQQELKRERQKEQEKERQQQLERERQREQEKERQQQLERERRRGQERQRQRELDKERQLLEVQKERQRLEELETIKEMERRQLLEFEQQKQKERERQQLMELEKQRLREKMEREETEKMKRMAIQQEVDRQKELERERERQREMEKERLKEFERERQRELDRQRQRDLERERQKQLDFERQELENQRQRDLERERQKQLDFERQELENQRLRQRELEKERQRKEEFERIKEIERRQLLEFEKQKQVERDRQQLLALEKQRLRERMEREEAEKMRQIAKQQEAERQRLKEKQRREEQERVALDLSPLRPKVLDLDSVLRGDPFSKVTSQHSDPATRWKQPSPRADEPYKPAILDIDSFTSQTRPSLSKDMFPVAGIQGIEAGSGARSQPLTPERDGSRKVPPEASLGHPNPLWAPSLQDPWELMPGEVSVDRPTAGPQPPRKPANKPSLEQLLHRHEELLLAPERRSSGVPGEPSHLSPFPRREANTSSSPSRDSSNTPMEQMWFPRELEPRSHREEVRGHRRSQGSQLNRMRSRSVSRRSAPLDSAAEGSISRMRSRSAHREKDRHSWVQQKQSVSGEEEGKEEGTLVHESDSQYGTWETGLRTDDSLTPATPTSDSNLSPSPRKPTPPHTPGDLAPSSDLDTPDGLSPLSPPESQPLPFPDAPTSLLDTSALRSRAQLGKKRGPRSRPSRAARQTAALTLLPEGEGGDTEDWRYRDSTEEKVDSKQDDSDSEEQAKGVDPRSAATAQPQRIPLFPGMDPSALKAQLKKRGDSDSQFDGPAPSPSQLSRSPKSPFLPRAARVLPPAGGKENGEEESPQWLRELKSKKRLSQYENDS